MFNSILCIGASIRPKKFTHTVSQIYVADDDEALERFKIAYPEINVGVFDMSNEVS
jgi:hypothetical protein